MRLRGTARRRVPISRAPQQARPEAGVGARQAEEPMRRERGEREQEPGGELQQRFDPEELLHECCRIACRLRRAERARSVAVVHRGA